MPVMLEGVLSRVQAVEPSKVAADPKNAIPIFVDNSDRVIAEAVGVIRVVLVGLKTVPIVAIESSIGAEPNEAVVVLGDALNAELKRFPTYGELGKADILLIHDRQLHEARMK